MLATAALALLAGALAGIPGAVSAVLGGGISVVAGAVSAMVALRKTDSAGGVLIAALMAEGIKIGLVVVLLWVVLAAYEDMVMPAFFGAFFLTILFFSMAFFVREYK